MQYGDNIDTKDSNGLQFLSFKLSFNDYYIQDISKKIKSVKKKKMYAGEYQAGIAPYGYKKDTEIKNHLIIDENVYHIVQEIFDMYANKGMSTIKIADELNRRNVIPPGIYMNMPNTRKQNSKNPDGRYVWLRGQIGCILKNQIYIGNVVSGKKEQINPKIKKGKMKEKTEYIVVEHMHEPIINKELWDKVQEKLNSYSTNNKKKYEYPLKDLVYCGECGHIARFQHCKSRNKKGMVYWEGNYAICGKRADYKSLCDNKMIFENKLINIIKETIRKEIEKIEYTQNELKDIYNKAKNRDSKKPITSLEEKVKDIDKINKEITELYEKKIMKQISLDDFKILYQKANDKKLILQKEIDNLKETKDKKVINTKDEYKQIKKIANDFLKMENPSNDILKKLVKRIEFDKNEQITVELTFSEN